MGRRGGGDQVAFGPGQDRIGGKIYVICNLDQVRTEVELANDDQLELVVAMTCGRLLRLQP